MELKFQSIFHNHQVTKILQSQISEEGRKFKIVSGDNECVFSNKLWMFSSFIRSIVETLVIADDINIILPDYSGVDVTNAINILFNNKKDELVFSTKVKEIFEALGVDVTNAKVINDNYESKETKRKDLINVFVKKDDASNISCKFCPKIFHGSKRTDEYKIHLGIIHLTAEMKIEVDKYFLGKSKCSACEKVYESSSLKKRHLIYNHSHLHETITSLIKDQKNRDESTEDEESGFLNQLLKFNQDLSDNDSDEEANKSNYIDEIQNCNEELSDSDSDEDEERIDVWIKEHSANDKEAEDRETELMISNQNLSDSDTDNEDEEANMIQKVHDQHVEEDQFQDLHYSLLQVQDLEDTDSEDEAENHDENEE